MRGRCMYMWVVNIECSLSRTMRQDKVDARQMTTIKDKYGQLYTDFVDECHVIRNVLRHRNNIARLHSTILRKKILRKILFLIHVLRENDFQCWSIGIYTSKSSPYPIFNFITVTTTAMF
ncbi:hypothetical protein DINM_001931 [Dirofilaria immitis]|nr:hypothetical protein [Dirofilaria immitis]